MCKQYICVRNSEIPLQNVDVAHEAANVFITPSSALLALSGHVTLLVGVT